MSRAMKFATTGTRRMPVPTPVIDNDPWVGVVATCSTGVDRSYPYTFQWYRDGSAILGATGSQYTYVTADIGPAITCKISYFDTDSGPSSVTSAAKQCTFTSVAEKTGDADDIALWLDTRDLTAGAFTSWTCRATGLVASGNGTCNTSINSKKTAVFSGSSGQYLLTPTLTLGSAKVLTPCLVPQDASSGTGYLLQYGPLSGSDTGFRIYSISGGTLTNQLISGAAFNTYSASDTLATAAVWCTSVDAKRFAENAKQIWKNGAQVSTSSVATNSIPATAVFPNAALSIGADQSGANRYNGAFTGAIVIFKRWLTWDERQHAMLIQGYLSGVSVTYTAQTVPGIAFGMAGQSNATGFDTDVSTLPSPWPPSDTASRLKKYTVTSTVSLSALQEPVNGAGGTFATGFADALIRDPGYSDYSTLAIVSAPPQNNTSIQVWISGTANYNNLMRKMWNAKTDGYDIGGLLWYQGEADAISNTNLYKASTQQMFSDLRADLLITDMRIVMVRLHTTVGAVPNWADIRQYQLEISEEDPDNLLLVQSFGALIGSLHLTTVAQMNLGIEMAAEYVDKWPEAA